MQLSARAPFFICRKHNPSSVARIISCLGAVSSAAGMQPCSANGLGVDLVG
jgi:hypothetical protein